MDILIGKALPQVNHVAHVSHAHGVLLGNSLADGRDEFVEIVVELVHPTLCVALLGSQRVDFGNHADHSGNVAGLWLGARHTAESG